MDSSAAAIVATLLFLLIFPLFWCGIVWLLAQIGGWARLAQDFRTDKTPRGTPFHWQSGAVGWTSYRGVLQLAAAPEGLFLSLPWLFRVGHAPLFIPWSAFHDAVEQQILWLRQVRSDVGASRVRLRLPASVFAATDAGRHLIQAK